MRSVSTIVGVGVDGPTVVIDFAGGGRAEAATVWLRDACRCAACRDPATMIRREGLPVLDPELPVREIASTDDGASLRCVWPDGHETVLDAGWLRRHLQRGPGHGGLDALGPQERWCRGFEPPTRRHEELDDPATLLAWSEALWRFGVARLTDVPTTRAALREVAGRLGPIRASNYGPDWSIEASTDPFSPVDSDQSLRVHVDLPYREVPPGVQFNLCVVNDATGGAATLTDGFAVADAIRDEDPRTFAALTTVDVPTHWRSPDHDLEWSAPIVELGPDGEPRRIRYAPGLVGLVAADPATTRAAYGAHGRFTELANDDRFRITVPFEPGDLLALHNHRVLHGRTSLDLRGGARTLLGCYLDVDDLHSTIRVLRRHP